MTRYRKPIIIAATTLLVGCASVREQASSKDPYDYSPTAMTAKEAVAYFIDFVDRGDPRAAQHYLDQYRLSEADEAFVRLVVWESTSGRWFEAAVARQIGQGKLVSTSAAALAVPRLSDEELSAARARLAAATPRPAGEDGDSVILDLTPAASEARTSDLLVNLLEQRVVVRRHRVLWKIDAIASFSAAGRPRLDAARPDVRAREARYQSAQAIFAGIEQGRYKTLDDVNAALGRVFSTPP